MKEGPLKDAMYSDHGNMIIKQEFSTIKIVNGTIVKETRNKRLRPSRRLYRFYEFSTSCSDRNDSKGNVTLMAYKRNYQREYAIEPKSRRKKRVNRNYARRQMMKKGLVKKGDGKDVHHVGGNALKKHSKLKVVSASKNRSYARTKNARKKES